VECARCHRDNPVEANFCLECGARLGTLCEACSGLVPPEAKFCPACGAAVVEPARTPYTPAYLSKRILSSTCGARTAPRLGRESLPPNLARPRPDDRVSLPPSPPRVLGPASPDRAARPSSSCRSSRSSNASAPASSPTGSGPTSPQRSPRSGCKLLADAPEQMRALPWGAARLSVPGARILSLEELLLSPLKETP
jgi:RNA polymerase subunit RPABC4/transcription elongation factor Spt4